MVKTNDSFVSKADFEAYVAVQRSGVTNMFAVARVCDLSGLTREQAFDIMKNYASYESAFGSAPASAIVPDCPSHDRGRLSPDCTPNPGGYCTACGAGSDHS